MKLQTLLAAALFLCSPALRAQVVKPTKELPQQKKSTSTPAKKKPMPTASLKTSEHAKGSNASENNVAAKHAVQKSLVISGDESIYIDSAFEYDVAVYQESVRYKGMNKVKNSGEYIVIYYSSKLPQYSIQVIDRATQTKHHFYGDFNNRTQVNMTGLYRMATGDKDLMDLKTMNPEYPGEINQLTQLKKTGQTKLITGVACEEYITHTKKLDVNQASGKHENVTAHIWIPMDPRSVFPAYAFIPDGFRTEIEIMKMEGNYPLVVLPLEMYFEYPNGEKVYTFTTDIIEGETRVVSIADINK